MAYKRKDALFAAKIAALADRRREQDILRMIKQPSLLVRVWRKLWAR